MDPITAMEILASVLFVIILFIIAILIPIKARKVGLILASSITLILILLFIIRPYWVNHQATIKTAQLNEYFEQKYPNEGWTIEYKKGRQYTNYQFDIVFENEKDWIYTYTVRHAIRFI